MNSPTILIVDDEPANLSLLMHLLRPVYQVRAANSGENALRVATSEPRPDLILLDVMMPGMDGYTVLERLRKNPATVDIPVIFVTALTDLDDEERGLALGAADYIAKPIKPAVVLARVRTQLEAKQTRDWLKDKNAILEAGAEFGIVPVGSRAVGRSGPVPRRPGRGRACGSGPSGRR
jgi:putative two-component system response regulator